jgi:peptide/nickel transport system ATP-binding protein
MNERAALLRVEDVVLDYPLPRRSLWAARPHFRALSGVSLEIAPGESFGLVGESGCGKSSLARVVMGLAPPTAGRILFQGEDIFAQSPAALRRLRRGFQLVFQDPYGSLDPRQRVKRIIAEPLRGLQGRGGAEESRMVIESLQAVGLRASDAMKYPHEFSGGQRQRIAIARALITRPALMVADEAVSALDVSVQAQVLNLMTRLRRDFGLAYLFISHDLAVVSRVTERVAVMFKGAIVESGPSADVFTAPLHPYAKALLAAVPSTRAPGRRKRPRVEAASAGPLESPRDASDETAACPYALRCPLAEARCFAEAPGLREIRSGRTVACHSVGAET